MRVARDYDGNLYDSYKDGATIKRDIETHARNFFCPNCGKPVTLRRRTSNAKEGGGYLYHFAHLEKSNCGDSWEQETSNWYREISRNFSGESVEKWVVNSKGEKHKADIIVGNIVIMFKMKDISAEALKDRIDFYTELGYDLAIIVGETGSWTRNYFVPVKSYQEYYGDMMLDWKKPKKMLMACPRIANTCSWVNGQRVSICISYVKEGQIYINKVMWVKGSENDDGILDWSKLRINSTCTFTIKDVVEDPNLLFMSPKEYIEDYVKKTGIPCKERFKWVERKGAAISDYKCPKTGYSLKIEDCEKCSSCVASDMFHDDNSKVANRVFCSYPQKTGIFDRYGFPKVKRVAR